jgi:hypothetical protein
LAKDAVIPAHGLLVMLQVGVKVPLLATKACAPAIPLLGMPKRSKVKGEETLLVVFVAIAERTMPPATPFPEGPTGVAVGVLEPPHVPVPISGVLLLLLISQAMIPIPETGEGSATVMLVTPVAALFAKNIAAWPPLLSCWQPTSVYVFPLLSVTPVMVTPFPVTIPTAMRFPTLEVMGKTEDAAIVLIGGVEMFRTTVGETVPVTVMLEVVKR